MWVGRRTPGVAHCNAGGLLPRKQCTPTPLGTQLLHTPPAGRPRSGLRRASAPSVTRVGCQEPGRTTASRVGTPHAPLHPHAAHMAVAQRYALHSAHQHATLMCAAQLYHACRRVTAPRSDPRRLLSLRSVLVRLSSPRSDTLLLACRRPAPARRSCLCFALCSCACRCSGSCRAWSWSCSRLPSE